MITTEIQNLIDAGALFVANHSGGKDSQATLIKLAEIIPVKQLLVVHATLGEIEWYGALELAQKQAADLGVPFIVARAYWKDGSDKTFLNMAERRFVTRPSVPSFPSKKHRQCTSDLKTGPLNREIRRYANKHDFKVVVSCDGIRAQESTDRAKKAVFELDTDESNSVRDWYVWRPIFTLTTDEVFATIRGAGQEPHPAYAAGNERLSCVFCIFASRNDLRLGAAARPDLFAKYVELEERTGYTMHMSRKSLRELVSTATL